MNNKKVEHQEDILSPISITDEEIKQIISQITFDSIKPYECQYCDNCGNEKAKCQYGKVADDEAKSIVVVSGDFAATQKFGYVTVYWKGEALAWMDCIKPNTADELHDLLIALLKELNVVGV